MSKLTIKQEKFILKYFECGNASEAYRHAYSAGKMKDETINNKAYLLLKKDEIRARLEELREEAQAKSEWNRERVLNDYARAIRVGFGDEATNHLISNGIGDGMSETINMQMYDTNLPAVNTALTNIAKILGLFEKDNSQKNDKMDIVAMLKEVAK